MVLASDGTRELLLGLALTAVLVPVALIDLDHRLIPNVLTLAGALAALAIGLATEPAGVPEQLLAGAAAGGFLLAAALARPGGMGMGDVKLAAVLGLFLGWEVGVALLVALLAGTIVGLAVMPAGASRRDAARRCRSGRSWRSAGWSRCSRDRSWSTPTCARSADARSHPAPQLRSATGR